MMKEFKKKITCPFFILRTPLLRKSLFIVMSDPFSHDLELYPPVTLASLELWGGEYYYSE